jgi:hypothetical protein
MIWHQRAKQFCRRKLGSLESAFCAKSSLSWLVSKSIDADSGASAAVSASAMLRAAQCAPGDAFFGPFPKQKPETASIAAAFLPVMAITDEVA